MKKYFIADILTAMKLIPAVCILIFLEKIDSGVVFWLFAAGEFLDALDGMAAKKWPHPESTNKLWFRKNIKLIESGLDMFLAISALVYIIVRIDFLIGISILVAAILVGTITEFKLYGNFFCTPEKAERWALFKSNPERAKRVVGGRLLLYLLGIAIVILILIWCAPWKLLEKVLTTVDCGLIAYLLIKKKLKDGRLDDVLRFLRIK